MKRKLGESLFLYIYAAVWTSYLILRLLFGERQGLLALASNFVPAALIPVWLVPFIGYKRRDWLLSIAGSLLTVFLLVEYGGRFLPRLSKSMRAGYGLTVLSHNTGQNLPGYENRYRLISDTDADIVLLQEVTEEFIQSYRQILVVKYPYVVIGPGQEDRNQKVGMGILSKYPIIDVSDFKLAEDGLVFQQRVVIDYKDSNIAVYNIHTTFPWLYLRNSSTFNHMRVPVYDDVIRRNEINTLYTMIKNEQLPIILGGDFNFGDQSDDYRRLRSVGLVDIYRDVGYGFGFTWPVNRTPSVNIKPALPFIRVDYIFHSRGFHPIAAKVIDETGSDHRPIWAELQLHFPER